MGEEQGMNRPVGIGHVVLNVTDLDRAVTFYTEVLGMKVSGQYEGSLVFLHFGQYREGTECFFHDLALYKVPNAPAGDRRKTAGLNHIAIRLRTPADVDAAAEHLKARGVKILKGPGTHKEDQYHYVYFEDPEGNVLEFMSPELDEQAYRVDGGSQAVPQAAPTPARERPSSYVPPEGLRAGLSHEQSIVTTSEHAIAHLGGGTVALFSTPAMIALMENTARSILEPCFREGEGSVGVRVDVTHLAATPIGQRVRCRATLKEIRGRRCIFAVEAYNEREKIGEGIHERAIVQAKRFTAPTGS